MGDIAGLKYKIVGRYMDGTSVVAYHILGTNGTEVKASKDLVTYYIGRGMIINAKCQPAADGTLIIRGVGVNLNELPVKNERTGDIKESHGGQSINTAVNTHKKKIAQMEIIARLFSGNKVIGYVLRDMYGDEKKLDRSTVVKMAELGRVSNAKVSQDGDDTILRGIGCKIDELPRMRILKNNRLELIEDKHEDDNRNSTVDKKKFNKTIDVTWDEVKEIISMYDKKAVMDMNSNAQGGYKYPIMEVFESNTARMCLDIGIQRYFIEEVEAGTSGIDNSYGIRLLITNINECMEVKCNDISYLAFHVHNIGMIAFTALNKIRNKIVLNELYFSDTSRKLMWREYFVNGNKSGNTSNTSEYKEIKDSVIVEKSDIVTLERLYDVELSAVSRLGNMKKYPTVNMVINGTAKMSIKTTSNYYECEKLSLSGTTEVNIEITLVNGAKGIRKSICYNKLSKEQLNMKNMLLISSAAFKGTEQIETVMVESGNENSVLAYDFTVKIH